MRKAFIVLNHLSGGSDNRVRQRVEKIFSEAGMTYEIFDLVRPAPLQPIVKDALERGFSLIVAGGGDGTVSSAASAIVGTDAVLGILPLGTGNALLNELQIPSTLEAAAKIICGTHSKKRIDAMECAGRYYLNNMGVGILPWAMRDTKKEQKRILGTFAYFIPTLRRLRGVRVYRFVLSVDGVIHPLKATEIVIANTSVIGNKPYIWGPNISPDDGVLNVCVFRGTSFLDHFKFFFSIILQRHSQDQQITYLEARESIEIQCAKRMLVQGDGGPIGITPFRVRFMPGAIRVIVPDRQK